MAFLAPLGAISPAGAQVTAEQALAQSAVLPALDGCTAAEPGEIVVCGRGGDDRYRLPPIASGDPFEHGRRLPGDVPRPSAGPLSYAPCGIFEGQRRCGKQESLDYGYGGGRDPLTVASRLITALTDPDGRPGPPPLPKAPRRP
jgi:hypothetical protein